MTNVEENIDSKGFSNTLSDKICSFLTVHIHGESRKPQGYLPMYHTEVATGKISPNQRFRPKYLFMLI